MNDQGMRGLETGLSLAAWDPKVPIIGWGRIGISGIGRH